MRSKIVTEYGLYVDGNLWLSNPSCTWNRSNMKPSRYNIQFLTWDCLQTYTCYQTISHAQWKNNSFFIRERAVHFTSEHTLKVPGHKTRFYVTNIIPAFTKNQCVLRMQMQYLSYILWLWWRHTHFEGQITRRTFLQISSVKHQYRLVFLSYHILYMGMTIWNRNCWSETFPFISKLPSRVELAHPKNFVWIYDNIFCSKLHSTYVEGSRLKKLKTGTLNEILIAWEEGGG
jgi:hypothetical protein